MEDLEYDRLSGKMVHIMSASNFLLMAVFQNARCIGALVF